MDGNQYVNLAPSPLSLIASLRDIGYSMETAIADIIDNSVTAEAKTVQIRFSWNADNPWIAIIDDGLGMSKKDLITAMRFGSMNPSEVRSANDLGRFGLGMKTASLSQCRHLTVLSKKDGLPYCCEWDLDRLARDNSEGNSGEWRLGLLNMKEIQERKPLSPLYNEYLSTSETGTIVLWENLDRLDIQSAIGARENHFDSLMADTRKHIELVFHRFLSHELGKIQVAMSMNGNQIEPFNPFCPGQSATQELEEQRFSLSGEEIVVQPYILPHHNKVSTQEYERHAGDGGYLQNQGLYIYRNRRLIIKGTWFRLLKKNELNKLIRIRVDIPNTLDHLWKIDVKKSNAAPPESVRKELRQIIGGIEIKGRKVYHQRGKTIGPSTRTPVWNRRAAGGSIIYELNRSHPLLKQILMATSAEHRGQLLDTIQLIESSFPADLFFNDFASNPDKIQSPELDEVPLEHMLDTFLAFGALEGVLSQDTIATILFSEPFSSNKELTKMILKKKGHLN